jgi:hypothetical protein
MPTGNENEPKTETVFYEATQAGHSMATIRRAKKDLEKTPTPNLKF